MMKILCYHIYIYLVRKVFELAWRLTVTQKTGSVRGRGRVGGKFFFVIAARRNSIPRRRLPKSERPRSYYEADGFASDDRSWTRIGPRYIIRISPAMAIGGRHFSDSSSNPRAARVRARTLVHVAQAGGRGREGEANIDGEG